MRKVILFLNASVIFIVSLSISSCSKTNSFNVFSVQDDVELGRQVHQEILSDPQNYPILSRAQYPEAYAHLERIADSILKSPDILHREQMDWNFYIVHRDDVLNAFAAPGGYIYFYTGLIKYLDQESSFAGVLGHEIAHADRRHVTDQLSKAYGVSVLLQVLLGNNQSILTDIAANLLFLSFSRNHESDADNFSVNYLCPTAYESDGAADFFMKIEEAGGGSGPEFLSTHPNPGNRVEAIKARADQLNCQPGSAFDQRYQQFKSSLP